MIQTRATFLAAALAAALIAAPTMAQEKKLVPAQTKLPPGYWSVTESEPILAKTAETRLAPDLGALDEAEKATVRELLQVGAIMQELYEISRHPEARVAYDNLVAEHGRLGNPKATQNLLNLYRLNQGPIAVTLDNRREPFLPVSGTTPGKNVYPWGITKQEVEGFLARNPHQRDEILGERTVVRRATRENLDRDLALLKSYPVIATLHPKLLGALTAYSEAPDEKTLYAVPYALAWAPQLTRAYGHLMVAADRIEKQDEEFARYLRNRARDLLSNDYESGDASWVTGRFKTLNAQIGAYETYDDSLYGVKAFHALSLLKRNEPATKELVSALGGLQEIENALPYDRHKRVREDLPVGVYEVIADFGQARGANTATILPNDALFSRRYGRTILLRENIMRNPDIFANSKRAWDAVVSDELRPHLVAEGDFYRTLWHEIGHYLGVDRTTDGRNLDVALEEHADALEEMKSDLVSLFALPFLRKGGYHDEVRVRSIYAAGIRRTLQNVKPRSDQPYQVMQLAQFNYFLENGVLSFDSKRKTLSIDYTRYPDAVTSLLRQVLALQSAGDGAAAAAFFARYGAWKPELHEAIAAKIRDAQGARFRIIRYAALRE